MMRQSFSTFKKTIISGEYVHYYERMYGNR